LKVHGQSRRYLLTGFAFCGLCGNKLTCSRKRRDKSQPLKPTYNCRRDDDGYAVVGCERISRNGVALEDFVTDAILYRLDGDGLAQALSSVREDKQLLSELMADVDTRTARLNDLTDDYATGLLDRSQFARAKGTAEAALGDARDRLSKEMNTRTVMNLPMDQGLRSAWQTADLEWRRNLIALMIERVVVNTQTRRPFYKDLGRFDPDAIVIEWRL
jgi:hypothetical protein